MFQPPTDNLYKFMAIFGLVVFGFSVYVPLQKLEEHNKEIARWNAAWGALTARAIQADDTARLLLDCAIKEAKALPSEECRDFSTERSDRLRASRDLEYAMGELQSGKEMLAYLAAQFELYKAIGLLAGALGFLICAVGFWRWYIEVQRPLDRARREKVFYAGEDGG